MRRLLNAIMAWIPLAVIVTAFCGLAYVTAQQVLRQGANDPQIQMAEDAAVALNKGANLGSVVPRDQVEFSNSLAPFLVVYDAAGKPVASSGLLHGEIPDYPMGALEAARQRGENRVTWQPEQSVRIASVVVPYKDGYVVAGRSLREVENREAQMEGLAAATWVVTLVGVLAVVVVLGMFSSQAS
jgi:hypothetical protein